jgi:hypothetical protein
MIMQSKSCQNSGEIGRLAGDFSSLAGHIGTGRPVKALI